MSPLKFNPLASEGFDYYAAESDPLSLHLDQTTPQTISGGTPVFDEGISILAGKKLILDGG